MKLKPNRTRDIAIIAGGIVIVLGLLTWMACTYHVGIPITDDQVKRSVRASSVQINMFQGAMRATFTDPLPEQTGINEDVLTKKLREQLDKVRDEIKEAISKEREWQNADRYETFLSPIDRYGFQSQSRTHIPLGALVDGPANFPERILVVTKVEKQEIKEWEKDYETDVLAISETANVSPSKAKEILSRLRTDGYSVSKEAISKTSDVVLLHFASGWNDKYPTKLDWTVEVSDVKENFITGYDPRGILEVRPIPESNGEIQRVHVKAGYFGLKAEYRDKPFAIKELEKKVEDLERQLKEREKELQEIRDNHRKESGDLKRKISQATWFDVKTGIVQIEFFYFFGGGSGTFLGNMAMHNVGTWARWFPTREKSSREGAVILTNAHVARVCMEDEILVSRDEEEMWIIMAATPFIRYTSQSDTYGSPAQVMTVDDMPVYSVDYDTAIMTTTPVPGYESNAARFGDSDRIEAGNRVVLTGNPSWLQKYTTQGVIGNAKYSFLDALDSTYYLKYVNAREQFASMRNTSLWIDAPGLTGGSSGSGIFALDGSQKGKMVGLMNVGLVQAMSSAARISAKGKSLKYDTETGELRTSYKGSMTRWQDENPVRSVRFDLPREVFQREYPKYHEIVEQSGRVPIAGFHGGVPINGVKRYLQERGLDPEHFGWEGLTKGYWQR